MLGQLSGRSTLPTFAEDVYSSVFVTVCICTKDRPAYVRQCLNGLRNQSAPATSFEVVIVDSGSSVANASILTSMVQSVPCVTLIREDRPGLSRARNAGARIARGQYIAFIDDDAVPDTNWLEAIRQAASTTAEAPALIGGRILPVWEADLPRWWPASLRGVLTLVEYLGEGEYGSAALPAGAEPYGANVTVRRADLLQIGGFSERAGRRGPELLSDEDVQLAKRLQNAGKSVRYDSRITVWHHIQANRMNVNWLLSRLYWQGVSTVRTRRALGDSRWVWRQLLRRIAVCVVFLPARIVPRESSVLLSLRWRFAYSQGFIKAALGSEA